MGQGNVRAEFSRGVRLAVPAGLLLLVAAVVSKSWFLGFLGLLVLLAVVLVQCAQIPMPTNDEPWPWPADFRASVERMVRPIDPTPRRVVPLHEKASEVAHVATSMEDLARLLTDKPIAWEWAAFASVLVQRRNDLLRRLRTVSAGYQPDLGQVPISAEEFAAVAHRAMSTIAKVGSQAENFMASPAFTGAFGDLSNEVDADADAMISVAHRLMDYHAAFLAQAEVVLQTPVTGVPDAFLEDLGAFVVGPLVGYEKFIPEMCDRIAQAQELIPYAKGKRIQLDGVHVSIALPDGLLEKTLAHFNRSSE